MKILLEGQYKYALFKEFTDDHGNAREVGQALLKELLSASEEGGEMEQVEVPDALGLPEAIYSPGERRMLKKMQTLLDEHTLRYAKIDYLYWYEFQNKCSSMLEKYQTYLGSFGSNQDILRTKESQQFFVEQLDSYLAIVTAHFDIMNCEKCTNIAYFALSDDIYNAFTKLFGLKVLGSEAVTMRVFELFDSLLILCSSVKQTLKFGSPNQMNLSQAIIAPFVKSFVDVARQMAQITNKEAEEEVVRQRIAAFKAKSFAEVKGLRYSVYKAYELAAMIVLLSMNIALSSPGFRSEQFEKDLPPQYTFEILVETLANPFVPKDVKIQVVEVMNRLIQLDIIPRFRYDSARRNPYFAEAVKYQQYYIEIFQKMAAYHTEDKLKQAPRRQEGQDIEMQDESKGAAVAGVCSDDQDYIKSQSFLSDFLGFLEDIARVKQRQVNISLFSQIIGPIVSIITVRYTDYVDPKTGKTSKQMYPLNLSCQIKACKLLKSALKTQQSFDDTQKLEQLIVKLKDEINLIKLQSQHPSSPSTTQNTDPKSYLQIYDKSWPDDDDYLSKYQTLEQRQQLIRLLIKFLCFCIVRNDPNLISYNQNFVAHSRKILESSVIQDDMLLNIFKIHETLPNQEDQRSRSQIEETVSPLVLSCIQLATQVFNDLPSKISTFLANGVFQGIISSLTNGGIPPAPDMLHNLASFMHMLTLNAEASCLLKESHFIQKLCLICEEPQRYHRFVAARRRDDYSSEQMLQNVANSDAELSDQMFQTILDISREILPRSHKLLGEYVAMDKQLRKLEAYAIANEQSLTSEEKQKLNDQKNSLKQPYEINQQNFENFFSSYYVIMSYLLEQDRMEFASNNIVKSIEKYKAEIMTVIYEGIQNPVVASALHQHSEEYVTVIMYILSSSTKPEDVDNQTSTGKHISDILKVVITCLRIQIDNIKKLQSQNETSSSLVEGSENAEMGDLRPAYCSNLNLFECINSERKEAKLMQEFINGDSELSSDDQMAIVLRKIYFYMEILIIFQKQFNDQHPPSSAIDYGKVKFLFDQEAFDQILLDLFDLSTLITKNRGINYEKSINSEANRLQKLIEQHGASIRDYHFDEAQGFVKNQRPTNDLIKGRQLYFKHCKQLGDISIAKDYEKQSETADVMNFECDDTICTHAQACQNQIKKLVRVVMSNINRRRISNPLDSMPAPLFSFCYESGSKQIKECLQFISNGNRFLVKHAETATFTTALISDFDNILFDVISGLFQSNKMIQQRSLSSFSLPGSFIKGLLETINSTDFIEKVVSFAIRITQFTEQRLQNGDKMPLFRLSYIKVMWKDISLVLNTLLAAKFLPHDAHLNKFLMDFQSDHEIANSKLITDRQKSTVAQHLQNQAKVNLKNMLITLYHGLAKAMFSNSGDNLNIFQFMNMYCRDTCFKTLLKVYDHLLLRFQSLHVFKRLAVKGQQGGEKEVKAQGSLNHLGNFGRGGRYEVYAGGPPRALELLQQAAMELRQTGSALNSVDENLVKQLQDMGFQKENAERALALNNNNLERSIDVLVKEQAQEDQRKQESNEEMLEEPKEAGKDPNTQTPMQPPSTFNLQQFMESIKIEEELNLSPEFSTLICYGFSQLISDSSGSDNDLLYGHFSFDSAAQRVYGHKIRMDKIYSTITILLKIYSDHDPDAAQRPELVESICQVFRLQYESLFSPEFVMEGLENASFLKNLIVKIFIFKKLDAAKVFDAAFMRENPKMQRNCAIKVFIEILNRAVERLGDVFAQINKDDKHQDEQPKEATKEMNQLLNDQLPLLQALVQMTQEILVGQIMNDQLDSEVHRVLKLAQTIKDSNQIAQPSESSTKKKIDIILQYHQQIKETFLFDGEEGSSSSVKEHLEELMMSQILLLKVYNQTPFQRYNHEGETLYPVTVAISILKETLRISDACQPEQLKTDLRKKFMHNDGLKYLFGVRVVDSHCSNPDELQSLGLSQFIKDQLQNELHGSLLDNFVSVLINPKQSLVQIYENYIKQLMFIQYRQNCKRESKKDIAEWFRPVFEGMDYSGPGQSPRTKKQQTTSKSTGQSLKKNKERKAGQESISGTAMNKNQSKQLKILMKKNESYNEVPLKQFIEFFLKSQCSMQIDHFEYFLAACKNICVIDIVDNEQIDEQTKSFKAEKITTIKLKNTVLRELILESKNEQSSQAANLKASGAKSAPSWQTEFKKKIVDFQFQNETIQQLLDIFILQIKGQKMNILRCLKSNQLDTDSECKIQIKDNKLFLAEANMIEMSKYLFDSSAILHVISNEVIQNPLYVGSVLKHREQKTFKYIIRNILALKYLRIAGKEKQIVFEEEGDLLDTQINLFFKRMLLDTHTIAKPKKIYRQEARRVFVKEVTKNLVELEYFKSGSDSVAEHGSTTVDAGLPANSTGFNTKLLQNYGALLLISQFLTVQDKKNDKLIQDQRVRALFQSIRRYNQEQKNKMLNQIIYETQLSTSRTQLSRVAPSLEGIKINFFKHIHRIRNDLESESQNPIIKYKPKALAQCIDIVLSILNQYCKNKEILNQLVIKPAAPLEEDIKKRKKSKSKIAQDSGSKAHTHSQSAPAKEVRRGSAMDNLLESDSEDEAGAGLPGVHKDEELTLEDKQDIEQMRDEDRRSNLERQIPDADDESDARSGEESEADDLDDLSEDDDSYGFEEHEDDQIGEFSDADYGQESAEDEYYDQEGDELEEEGEGEMIPLFDGDNELLVNSNGAESQDDEEAESEVYNLSSYDDDEMQHEEAEDVDETEENNFESYSEDELDYQDDEDAGFGDGQSGFGQDHQLSASFPNSVSDDDFSSSLNSASGPGFNQERDERNDAIQGYGPELSFNEGNHPLNRLNAQLENRQLSMGDHFNAVDLREFENQLASYGVHRVQRDDEASRSRSRSAHSSNSQSQSLQMSQQGPRTRPYGGIHNDFSGRDAMIPGLTRSNILSSKRRENEDDFWNHADGELSRLSTQASSMKILAKRILVFNELFSRIIDQLHLLKKQVRTDENLFLQNIMLVVSSAAQLQLHTCQDEEGTKLEHNSSLIDNIGMNGQTAAMKVLNNDEETNGDEFKMVQLSKSEGFDDFMAALAKISGEEEVPYFQTKQVTPARNEESKQPEKDASQDQIVENRPNTLDQIDPLFTSALNAPSLQIIKENDQLIKKIQIQSSISSQQHIQTINEFLKKQGPEMKKHLLKNLGQHILSYLSSDLYAEAKRLRQQHNPQQPVVDRVTAQNTQIQSNLRPFRGLAAHPRRANQLAPNQRAGQAPPNQPAFAARNQIAANTDASLPIESPQAALSFQRNRFISMESQTIDIDDAPTRDNDTGLKRQGQLRDSESEDLNIPQQRSNFHVNAFYFNIHTYMKENMLNLQTHVIRDILPSQMASKKKEANRLQIFTNEDLEQFCESLIIDQFKEDQAPQDQEQISSSCQDSKANVTKIVGILDIAITEIICSRANMQLRKMSPEKQLSKFKIITQIPNFRIGLIVKIVSLMNHEMQGLSRHISQQQGSSFKKLGAYKGCTRIWELPKADTPVVLSPKACLSFFVKYIYQLQQMLFETKSSKTGILDLLKLPNSDPYLKLLYQELGLQNLKCSGQQADIMDMTILDQILQMIVDYIRLLCSHPDSFEFEESQQREFNRWKQEILQNICLILQQLNVALNILTRKHLSDAQRSKYENSYSLSNKTLDKIFMILFFLDQDGETAGASSNLLQQQSLFMDESQNTIKMVSRLLNRMSLLPIKLQEQDTLPPNESLLDLSPKPSSKEKANGVIHLKLSQILNRYLSSFTSFFEEKFKQLEQNRSDASTSILAGNSKNQKKQLILIIEKIQHIIKISLNVNSIEKNICQDQYLHQVLSIVQMVIDNEELHENNQKKAEALKREPKSGSGMEGSEAVPNQNTAALPPKPISQTYLFKEEFKLIMQLIFTLSEYDLKYEQLDQRQEQHVQAGSNNPRMATSERDHAPARPSQVNADLGAEPRQNELPGNRNGGRQSRRDRERRAQSQLQVVIQSIDDIRREYDPKSRSRDSVIDSAAVKDKDSQEIAEVLSKYRQGRVQDLIRFFFVNKKLINKFIRINQTVINDQFQNLVIQVPQILDFDSKRLLWKICIKKHLRKNVKAHGEFEIDLQVRRNQVFGDSFEQLRHIELESWKQKFTVEFHDEEGVDEGGLTKEWFELLSQGIFDPNYALFLQSAKGSTYYPNPSSVVHERDEMTALFRFVGRIIGKAILEGQLLDCYFVKALYKMMLNNTLLLADLEDYDEQIHKSLIYMLENDAEMLCQSFVFSSKIFDEEKDIELKPDGANVDVTNDNKFEYCQLVLHYRLYQCIKPQVDAFLQGFHDLVPSNLIKIFDYKELELLISGLPTVDIEDLKENTIYKNYTKQSPVINWLWEVLEELSNSERAEFLQFVTGSSKVPVEGFKALRGNNGFQKFQVVKYQLDRPDGRLPQAHTCFFQLDLPEYSSKEVLRQRIMTAIKEGKTFGIA